jgi:2-methylcitrate dehydratase PrpD
MLAVAAVNRRIDPDDLLIDRRDRDPRILDLARRTILIGHPELEPATSRNPAVVEVTTRDGHRFVKRVDHAKGSRENPLSRAELERKFFDLATTRLSRDRAERLLALVDRLEELDDVARLTELLAVPEADEA